LNQPPEVPQGLPHQEPEVPIYPFPERQASGGGGDWFGPIMIGIGILVAVAVGFAMVVAVFPEVLGGDESAEIEEALAEQYADEDWYELVETVTYEEAEDLVVVSTTAEDDSAEGLDSLCEATYEVAAEIVEDATVSVLSESGDEIVECSDSEGSAGGGAGSGGSDTGGSDTGGSDTGGAGSE
jgi:hypothetical protein